MAAVLAREGADEVEVPGALIGGVMEVVEEGFSALYISSVSIALPQWGEGGGASRGNLATKKKEEGKTNLINPPLPPPRQLHHQPPPTPLHKPLQRPCLPLHLLP